jgi:hypothetical protein
MTSRTDHEPSGASLSAFGRLRSVVRGDKYMVGAYPPEWHERTPTTERPPVVSAREAAAVEPAAVPMAR